MMKKNTKEQMIEIGIAKLKNFGFVNVKRDNILKDEVYRYYFKVFMNSLMTQNQITWSTLDEVLASPDVEKL